MASQTGFNLSASDMKSLLERINKQQSGVRTWRQLFGNASLGYNAQSSALTSDYASAVAEAYKTNQAQRNALLGAGLNTGATKDFLAQSRKDLQTAYDTYIRNYATDASKLATAYSEEVNTINTALTERATNFSNLYNSAYKYLTEELYGTDYVKDNNLLWTSGNQLDSSILEQLNSTKDWTEFDRIFTEAYLAQSADPTPKSWNDLSSVLFDANGNLTAKGTEFFDQIFNATPQGYTRTDKDGNEIALRSFDQWLSDTDSKLRDWAVSADVFNYNRTGTNLGTAKVLAGLESDDMKYHQGEYLTEKDAEFVKYDFSTDTKGMTDALALWNNAGGAEGANKLYYEYKRLDKIARDAGSAININNYKKSEAEIARRNATAAYNAWQRQLSNYETAKSYYDNLKSSMSTKYNETLNHFKQIAGSDLYKSFEAEYADVVRAYEDASKLDFSEENVKKLSTSYENLMQSIKAFIKKHGYTGKISGF